MRHSFSLGCTISDRKRKAASKSTSYGLCLDIKLNGVEITSFGNSDSFVIGVMTFYDHLLCHFRISNTRNLPLNNTLTHNTYCLFILILGNFQFHTRITKLPILKCSFNRLCSVCTILGLNFRTIDNAICTILGIVHTDLVHTLAMHLVP